ncbi:uncharacterized protein ISCGN_023864 [Ixodes scapularis]
MVKKNSPCSSSLPWQRYEVQVKGLFASYDEARRKLDKSQYTSDLASEDEPPQKRRRTPATRWDPTDDTCSSLWSEDSAGTLPPEVPTDFPQACVASDGCRVESPILSQHGRASLRPRQALANPSPHGTPQDGVQAYSGQTPCPGPTALPEREFQGQVLRLLNVIRLSLQQVASTLDALTASSEPTAAPNPVVPQPFDTADGLSNFEADLSASDEALLVKELIQLGGRNPNTATKRMLAYLLTDKLAAEYSWEGKKGKKKFCKLRICQLMCAAVNKRFTQSTKDDVEVTTKSWLRHAPEREYGKASQR